MEILAFVESSYLSFIGHPADWATAHHPCAPQHPATRLRATGGAPVPGPEFATTDNTSALRNRFGRYSTAVGAIGSSAFCDAPTGDAERDAAVTAGALFPVPGFAPRCRSTGHRAVLPHYRGRVGKANPAMSADSCNGHALN